MPRRDSEALNNYVLNIDTSCESQMIVSEAERFLVKLVSR